MRTIVAVIIGLAVFGLAALSHAQQFDGGPWDRATEARAEKAINDLGYLLNANIGVNGIGIEADKADKNKPVIGVYLLKLTPEAKDTIPPTYDGIPLVVHPGYGPAHFN
jgi:hypothetical protein